MPLAPAFDQFADILDVFVERLAVPGREGAEGVAEGLNRRLIFAEERPRNTGQPAVAGGPMRRMGAEAEEEDVGPARVGLGVKWDDLHQFDLFRRPAELGRMQQPIDEIGFGQRRLVSKLAWK